MSSGSSHHINADNCKYCFIDLDLNNYRRKLATAAAFVDATDARYGFSSKDLRYLGGSELSRVPESIAMDHEWSSKDKDCGGIETRPPLAGNRIVVELFWNIAPLACENFASLCANGSSFLAGTPKQKQPPTKAPPIGESGKPLTYRGSIVHRVIPGFVLQGGDFVFGNGSGGESIYNGKKFKDERAGLALKHDRKGILSMGNSGKNSNSSQFFFTFDKAPQCDGKHVVFGRIISGMDVLQACEQVGTSNGTPTVPISITDCGIYQPFEMPGAGYWYDQPDTESYSGISPVFMVRPRVIVVAPTDAVLQKFASAMGNRVAMIDQITIPTATTEGNTGAQQRINQLLEEFSADVVVVAPACKTFQASIEIPKSWHEAFGKEDIVVVSKPVEALAAVRSKSWLAKRAHWQLDGSC